MKRLFIVLSILWGCWALQAAEPSINVTGDAEVKVVPDRITIIMGVETHDANLETARNGNNEKIRKILESLRKNDVPQGNIQTDTLSIYPHTSSYKIISYQVNNNVSIQLQDPAAVEKVVADAISAGANVIRDINFSHSELRKYRDQARAMALKAAREKAQDMAAVLNQKIGRPLSISENLSPYNYYRWGRNMAFNTMQNVSQSFGGNSTDCDTLELGKISIRANVGVTFELKNE